MSSLQILKSFSFTATLALFGIIPVCIANAATTSSPTPASSPTAKKSYNVRDFGAVGDNKTKDTAAFQKALDTCAVNGGGDVIVPAGVYLIGSVQMGTQTFLRLAEGAVINGSPDLDDYPMMDIRWEGRTEQGRRSLIFAMNVDHIGITGPGIIQGNPAAAQSQNPRGALVLEPINCNDVLWDGFTVSQGGNWATHPTYCTDVIIKNLHITGRRDGIDIDSCKHVVIDNCNVDTGDDSISLKSGRGMDGARLAIASDDILISNCTLRDRTFACIGIGSETSGGVRNVRIEHCHFVSSGSSAIYIKTRIGRGGSIENISGDDLDVQAGGFLQVNLISSGNQNTADDSVDGLVGYPQGRNFSFTNVRVTCTTLVDITKISTEKPLDGLTLKNITGTSTKGITLANITGAKLSGIKVTGMPGAMVTVDNVTGTGLDDASAAQ